MSFDKWASDLADHIRKKNTKEKEADKPKRVYRKAELGGECLQCNDGTYEIKNNDNLSCSCHIRAPCGKCEDSKLICPTCEHDPSE